MNLLSSLLGLFMFGNSKPKKDKQNKVYQKGIKNNNVRSDSMGMFREPECYKTMFNDCK